MSTQITLCEYLEYVQAEPAGCQRLRDSNLRARFIFVQVAPARCHLFAAATPRLPPGNVMYSTAATWRLARCTHQDSFMGIQPSQLGCSMGLSCNVTAAEVQHTIPCNKHGSLSGDTATYPQYR